MGFVNSRPYNLYGVGGDVKPCSFNQSMVFQYLKTEVLTPNRI